MLEGGVCVSFVSSVRLVFIIFFLFPPRLLCVVSLCYYAALETRVALTTVDSLFICTVVHLCCYFFFSLLCVACLLLTMSC